MPATSQPDEPIRLTQYSHGAGCGCKIAPAVLDKILHSSLPQPNYPDLLVGNGSRDDAAVYRLPGQDGQCVISTTDFFMPIVDDAYDFGRIASANAISDVYAMGGRPILAIAVLGWPIGKLAPEVAARVTEGARAICAEAGIPLAGGHSIDAPEPIFGLAVTGLVAEKDLKRNDTRAARLPPLPHQAAGRGHADNGPEARHLAARRRRRGPRPNAPAQQNRRGAEPLARGAGPHRRDRLRPARATWSRCARAAACKPCSTSPKCPAWPPPKPTACKGAVPGGTARNYASYGHKIGPLTDEQQQWLCDPQTSGGLLVCVTPDGEAAAQDVFQRHGLALESFGELRAHRASEPWIVVQ